MIWLYNGKRQTESEIIVQDRERYISQMGPLCSKGQFRTLNHYDSRGIVCDQCVSLRPCVCVYLERPSTCLSHVLPHGHALPQTFSYCVRTTAHTLTHSSRAPWVSCGIIMQLEKFQMVPWKADLSCALPCPVIWLRLCNLISRKCAWVSI